MKVSFVIYDDAGKAADEGTIDEFWGGPSQWKEILTSKVQSQAFYGTTSGVLRAGAAGPESDLLLKVSEEYTSPINLSEKTINETEFLLQRRMIGESSVRCLTPKNSLRDGIAVPTYCVGDVLSVLQSAVRLDDLREFVHSKSVIFQRHYVPQDVEVLNGQSTMLRAHLDLLEAMQPPAADELKPPQDAVPARPTFFLDTKHLDYKHLKPKNPASGPNAAARGEIVMQAHIGTDGRVSSLFAVSGPPVLQKAALDAVRNWKSKSYIDPEDDQPAEVTRMINVSFP